MASAKKRPAWKYLYLFASLVYVGWVISLGTHDFGRVHREYRRAVLNTEPESVTRITLEELKKECLQRADRINPGEIESENDCRSWSAEVLERREIVVRDRLTDVKKRAGRKLLLFYVFFILIFLILPPLVVYIFTLIFIKIFATLKMESDV